MAKKAQTIWHQKFESGMKWYNTEKLQKKGISVDKLANLQWPQVHT